MLLCKVIFPGLFAISNFCSVPLSVAWQVALGSIYKLSLSTTAIGTICLPEGVRLLMAVQPVSNSKLEMARMLTFIRALFKCKVFSI